MIAKELEKNTLKLNAIEKIHLIEKLISSLDKPDPEIERSWIKEAEARFSAYEKGNLKTIPFEDVVKNLKRSENLFFRFSSKRIPGCDLLL